MPKHAFLFAAGAMVLCLGASAAAFAEEAAATTGGTVGVKLGAGFPDGELGTSPVLSVEYRRAMAFQQRLGFGLEVGFFSSTAEGEVSANTPGGSLAYEATATGVPIVASGFWRHPLGESLAASLSLGLAVTPLSVKSQAGDGGEHTEQTTAIGPDATLGIEYALGPGRLLGELGYRGAQGYLFTTGSGNLAGPSVRVGYRYLF